MNFMGFDIINNFFMSFFIVGIISYLVGSLNSAIIVTKIYAKDDIRRHGSGNAGMTNVLRTFGKTPAVFTALGDFFKGSIAVIIGRLIFTYFGIINLDGGFVAGFFVLLGHLFPIYFRFKGGKGILTACGVILILNPLVFTILICVYVPLIFIVGIVSIGSILGALSYPLLIYAVLYYSNQNPILDTIFAALIASIVIYMHRENISRLLNGTESNFKKKKQ